MMQKLRLIWVFAAFFAFFSLPATVNTAKHAKGGESAAATTAKAKAALFESHIKSLYDELNLQNKGLDFNVFRFAVPGYYNLLRENKIMPNRHRLAVADFRKPSQQKRLFIIDLASRRLLHQTWVAHGKNSGLVYAQKFSNEHSSLQSSLGFYKTDHTYSGQHGYSLYLDGMEEGFNDQARPRAIVMHGADYVTADYIAQHGRAGRSWGCPSVPFGEHTAIIDNLKSGNCLFIYSDDLSYLNRSKLLNFQKAADFFSTQNAY
ncbi:MAG: murein L,D-transpeptidase catalytic domain family protein [Sphingobacteriales bacterium]|nr:murein L,D-transpeptidase catalytic domain family protein [Sphingobacteriales bacterium]